MKVSIRVSLYTTDNQIYQIFDDNGSKKAKI